MSSATTATLYYSPYSCGGANAIAAIIGGTKNIEFVEVDTKSHTIVGSGADFYKINPKGNVPTIVLKDGTVLNENVATLLYVADAARESGGADIGPAAGSSQRYAYITLLAYLATEIHQAWGPLFTATAETKPIFLERIHKKFKVLEEQYLNGPFLFGDHFTSADSYLYIMLNWGQYVGVTYEAYPKITAYLNKLKGLESIQAAHKKIAELGEAQRKK